MLQPGAGFVLISGARNVNFSSNLHHLIVKYFSSGWGVAVLCVLSPSELFKMFVKF